MTMRVLLSELSLQSSPSKNTPTQLAWVTPPRRRGIPSLKLTPTHCLSEGLPMVFLRSSPFPQINLHALPF
eukprot:2551346-Amphidinium_carterae.1